LRREFSPNAITPARRPLTIGCGTTPRFNPFLRGAAQDGGLGFCRQHGENSPPQ